MACGRPAGYSDPEDSDEEFVFEKPKKRIYYTADKQYDTQKSIEDELQDAITIGDLDKTLDIIRTKLRGNVNSRLSSGWTPLIHACFHAQEHIVDALLRQNADVNLHGGSFTPLMAACSNTSADDKAVLSIVGWLVEKGSLINLGDMYGSTALMKAVINDRVCVVRELLKHEINIEMRDLSGWTAAFWAVHHNRQEILEILIEHDARLGEIDKNGRTLMEIASTHNYENIIDLLRSLSELEDEEEVKTSYKISMSDWKEYYPGVINNNNPSYTNEVQNLLYGMSCEHLSNVFDENHIDLRTFLLLDEEAMLKLGIDLPYERKRLKYGLRKFHTKSWKLSSVSGLFAQNKQDYSVLDCLSTLGSHHQQIYILEATLHYAMRNLNKLQDTDLYENNPTALNAEILGILKNIELIRSNISSMRATLTQISIKNPPPADLIIWKKPSEKSLVGRAAKLIIALSIGGLVYNFRNHISVMLKR